MYNLIEYSDNYLKTFGSLYQLCRDEPNNPITNSSLKSRFLNNTNNTGTINVQVAMLSKYVSNFWITLKMPLINCENNLILT